MGIARIVSGGPDGRYVIEMDYGESTRTAMLAYLTPLLAALEADLAAGELAVTEAEAKEAAKLLEIQQAQQKYMIAAQDLPPGSPLPDSSVWQALLQELGAMRAKHAPFRMRVAAAKFDARAVRKELGRWTVLQLIEQRDAWCATLTDNMAADTYRATIEIPGDSNLILLAEGGRGWTETDGQLRAREVMSPAQAYFNAAILPGWQIDRPMYRWGTITAIDYAAHRCDVSLADVPSSAQGLNVNAQTQLQNVPIQYMVCDADVFEVNDRVVVAFVGNNWDAPKVIGFVDNPKLCPAWPDVLIDYWAFRTQTLTDGGGSASWASSIEAGTFCGTSTEVAQYPVGGTYEAWSETTNARFAVPQSDPYEILTSLERRDWGVGQLALAAPQLLLPSSSPMTTITNEPEGITATYRPFSQFGGTSWSVVDGPDGPICVPTGVSGNKWDLVPVTALNGDHYIIGFGFLPQYSTSEVLGSPPPVPPVSVKRGAIVRQYELYATSGSSPEVLSYRAKALS